ncbi:MAG TPA: ferrochelatase [Fulvivirga sp.]|nr:ferrochelatase [Fulvivirga sp.]
MKGRTGVLLINLGTPDSPKVGDVRSYLFQFLNDPRVIDIPKLLRFLLVNFIIVPFRAPNSSKIYKKLWTDEGSPLLLISENVARKLDNELGADYDVHLAMRYKNPNIVDVLGKMKKENYSRIIVLTMFPQYASASTGSAYELVMDTVKKWWVIPEIRFVGQYFDHPDFIAAIVDRASKYTLSDYDHILFSYHGLPVRQVDKVYNDGLCDDRDCEHELTEENQYCYKATCYATTRLIAAQLQLKPEQYTVCFQSRLNKNWIEPFSDKVVEEKAKQGAKKLLIFSPAFTADCLETIIEIGDEYQEIFEANGGEKVQLVESLNEHPRWIQCLKSLVLS